MKGWMCAVLACAVAAGSTLFAGCSPRAARDRYCMTLEYVPEARTLTGEMTADIVNTTQNAQNVLTFFLWGNAYREGAAYAPVSSLYAPAVFYAGESYGSVTVSEVRGAPSFRICGEDDTLLEVTLAQPLYPDERIELGISFTLTLAKVNHRLGAGERAVTLSGFYPVHCLAGSEGHVYAALGDPFVSECADYDVTLTLPASYRVAHTGTGERTEQEGKAAYHVRARGVRNFAMVCSEHFRVHEDEGGEPRIVYCSLDDPDPARTLLAARRSLAFYADAFGGYDGDVYTVVQADLPAGGVQACMLTALDARLREEELPYALARATARQWWGSLVGSDGFCEAWQHEALCAFSAALFSEAHPEYACTYASCVEEAERAYRAFFSVWSQTDGGSDTSMRRPLTRFSGEYEYQSVVCDKGLILFERLLAALGREKTLSALRAYVHGYGGAVAPPEALIACFAARGAYAEGIFSSFLEGRCVI